MDNHERWHNADSQPQPKNAFERMAEEATREKEQGQFDLSKHHIKLAQVPIGNMGKIISAYDARGAVTDYAEVDEPDVRIGASFADSDPKKTVGLTAAGLASSILIGAITAGIMSTIGGIAKDPEVLGNTTVAAAIIGGCIPSIVSDHIGDVHAGKAKPFIDWNKLKDTALYLADALIHGGKTNE